MLRAGSAWDKDGGEGENEHNEHNEHGLIRTHRMGHGHVEDGMEARTCKSGVDLRES